MVSGPFKIQQTALYLPQKPSEPFVLFWSTFLLIALYLSNQDQPFEDQRNKIPRFVDLEIKSLDLQIQSFWRITRCIRMYDTEDLNDLVRFQFQRVHLQKDSMTVYISSVFYTFRRLNGLESSPEIVYQCNGTCCIGSFYCLVGWFSANKVS